MNNAPPPSQKALEEARSIGNWLDVKLTEPQGLNALALRLDSFAFHQTLDAGQRLNRAYSERAYVAAAFARMALAAGFKAGTGLDSSENDPAWRVVLYVETPAGQVSWHIHPDDQWVLEGLPEYGKPWDGTFKSRDGSFAKWEQTWNRLRLVVQKLGYENGLPFAEINISGHYPGHSLEMAQALTSAFALALGEQSKKPLHGWTGTTQGCVAEIIQLYKKQGIAGATAFLEAYVGKIVNEALSRKMTAELKIGSTIRDGDDFFMIVDEDSSTMWKCIDARGGFLTVSKTDITCREYYNIQ